MYYHQAADVSQRRGLKRSSEDSRGEERGETGREKDGRDGEKRGKQIIVVFLFHNFQ